MKLRFLLLLSIPLLFVLGCKVNVDDDLFDIECGPFDETKLTYFPQEPGDLLVFISEDSASVEERAFSVTSKVTLADTTLKSLFSDAVCDPYVDFILAEQDESRTFLGFLITDFQNRSTDGTGLSVNFKDNDFGGSTYLRSAVVDENGDLFGGSNTDVTLIDSLTLNGQLYENVIRLSMITPPEFSLDVFNDVRRVWIAPGVGLIRFEDAERGLYSRD